MQHDLIESIDSLKAHSQTRYTVITLLKSDFHLNCVVVVSHQCRSYAMTDKIEEAAPERSLSS